MAHQTPPAVQHQITLLASKSPLDRQKAAMQLGKLGHPDAVEPLIEQLWNEHDKVVRSNIILALEYLKDDRAVKPLLQMLRSEFEPIRGKQMLRVIIRLAGASVAPQLLQVLNAHRNVAVQREIVDLLGDIRLQEAIDPLLNLLNRISYQEAFVNQELRTSIMRALGLLRAEAAVLPTAPIIGGGSRPRA